MITFPPQNLGKRFHSLLIWGKLFLWAMCIQKCIAEQEIWHKQTLYFSFEMRDDGCMKSQIFMHFPVGFRCGEGGYRLGDISRFFTVWLWENLLARLFRFRNNRNYKTKLSTFQNTKNFWKILIIEDFRLDNVSDFHDEKSYRLLKAKKRDWVHLSIVVVDAPLNVLRQSLLRFWGFVGFCFYRLESALWDFAF